MALENFLNYLKQYHIKKSEVIHVEQTEMEAAMQGEKVPQILCGFSTITIELLKLLTNNQKYYKDFYVELIEKNNSSITLQTIDEIGFKKDYDFNKFKIIDALEWAKDNNRLNSEEIEKLKILKMSAEFSMFEKKYASDTKSISIEGRFLTLPVKEFIDVMNCSPIEIKTILQQENYKDMTLDEFVYALDDFLDENKILYKYYIPKKVSDNLNALKKATDITYINRCLEYPYNYLRRVEYSKKFKEEIFKDIPENFESLEKAFYIYYKMCKLLTYDEEQYARRKEIDYEIKHHDINRLKEIDSKNNRIVCYEFNALYAKFLRDLGIKYELEGSSEYANGHAALIFRVDKFIVRADSTVGLIKSDLAYAKNDLILTGFTLENKNENTYNKFVEKIDNVYSYIAKNDKNKYQGTIRDISKLSYMLPNNLPLEIKKDIFVKLYSKSSLPPIDKIPYALKLKNILFAKDNVKEAKFALNFISKKELLNDQEKYTVSTIISLNENGVISESNKNRYIALNSNGSIESLDYDEIKFRIETGIYKKAKTDNRVIPGFTSEEMNGDFSSNKTKIHK